MSILSDTCAHTLTYAHADPHTCIPTYTHTYPAGHAKKEEPVLKQGCVYVLELNFTSL